MSERLRILYVAYPLSPVSDESCGGAEQVLQMLERASFARGHHTTIVACSGSRASGELVVTVEHSSPDDFDVVQKKHVAAVCQLLHDRESAGQPFDLVHDHSGGFWKQASGLAAPVLATMHLPRSFYPAEVFTGVPANVFLNCVSLSQAASFADLTALLGVVTNGIESERFEFQPRKSDYLLWLGRICEEKAPHVALDVARRAGLPVVLAGGLYPLSHHHLYFVREIEPRLAHLGPQARVVFNPSFTQKVALLSGARAVLIPSLVDETSSLVAMEAMACGTPVIAFRRGALGEIITDGVTGYLAESEEEMQDALARLPQLDPRAARQRVLAKYSSARMVEDYERMYREVTSLSAQSKDAQPKDNVLA
jgi:glycosyltransferase involved in cell wall biosynthesis